MSKLPNISEDDLIKGLKLHSQKAYSLLYDRYSSALLGIICKIVRDEVESENLLQDTFVKIWKNIDSYDPSRGRLFTWMLNIARNTALNFLRSQKEFIKVEIQPDESGVYTENILTENASLNYIGVTETVGKLEPKLKQIIDLQYFLGYTQQEVANELNLPLGTVKTRTRMALQQLKKLFENG